MEPETCRAVAECLDRAERARTVEHPLGFRQT